MRHISTQIVGDNLKGEIAPFSFPLPSGGEEIRGAPLVYIPLISLVPRPIFHSSGWITSPLRSRSGDVIHPLLWNMGLGTRLIVGGLRARSRRVRAIGD